MFSSSLLYSLLLAAPAFGLPTLDRAATYGDVHARSALEKRETNPHLERDLKTLLEFKKHVTSDPHGKLTSWTGNDVCKFDGVVCDEHPDGYMAVAGVDFNGFELGGDKLVLAGLLDKLLDIALFHANSNGFTGGIPSDLSQIPYLYELDVSNNQLSGSFPKGVLTAVNLTFLDLRFNQFSGSIPSDVYKMDLEVLFLNDNQFSGYIDPAIGQSPALYVTLDNNKLSGSIPSTVANMKNLNEILLLGNQLSGSIPSGPWAQQNLTVFDASLNKLSGTVPEGLCKLSTLQVLNFTGNALDSKLGPECQKLQKSGVLTL
jgi:Leucine-rich repeat (LRR) protein